MHRQDRSSTHCFHVETLSFILSSEASPKWSSFSTLSKLSSQPASFSFLIHNNTIGRKNYICRYKLCVHVRIYIYIYTYVRMCNSVEVDLHLHCRVQFYKCYQGYDSVTS